MAGEATTGGANEKLPTMQMTPMIDVVFQMLIFFMVGMQIKIPEGILNSYLPKDRGVGMPEEEDNPDITPPEVRIRLEKNEVASTDENVVVDIYFEQYSCEDIQDLEDKLVRLGQELSSIPVVIDGDPEVPFSYILGTLNACVKARFTQISFKAPPEGL